MALETSPLGSAVSRSTPTRRRFIRLGAALLVAGPFVTIAPKAAFAQLRMASTVVDLHAAYGASMRATKRVETFDSLLLPGLFGQSTVNRLQQRGLDYSSNPVFSHLTSPPGWNGWQGDYWDVTHHFPAVDTQNDFAAFPFFNPTLDQQGVYASGVGSNGLGPTLGISQPDDVEIASVAAAQAFSDVLFVPFLNGQAMFGLATVAKAWLDNNMSLRLGLKAQDALTPLVTYQDYDTFTSWSDWYSDWQVFWTPAGKLEFTYAPQVLGQVAGRGRTTTRIRDFAGRVLWTWTTPVRWA